jgi:hypothetical protein
VRVKVRVAVDEDARLTAARSTRRAGGLVTRRVGGLAGHMLRKPGQEQPGHAELIGVVADERAARQPQQRRALVHGSVSVREPLGLG